MRKLLLVACFCLTFTSFVFAQTNYRQGYIVKSSGDTLKGYIDYKEWDNTPISINFKQSIAVSKPSSYTPETISSFGLTAVNKYVTYKGPLSTDKNIYPDIAIGLDTGKQYGVVFMHAVYENAIVELYAQQDGLKKRIFIAENGSAPVELIYYQYYGSQENSSIRYVNTFRQQLLNIAQRNSRLTNEVANNIDRTIFDENDIAKTLMGIFGDKAVALKSGSRFFVGLALNRTATKFDGSNDFSKAPAGITYSPRLSAGFDLYANPVVQQTIFRAELSVSYINPEFQNPRYSDPTTINKEVYHFNQLTIALSPQLLVNFYNKENFKVFLGGGVNLNYSIYSNNSYQLNSGQTGTPYKLKAFWVNLPVQAGVAVNKKVDVFFMYTHPFAYTDYQLFSISNKVFSIGAHYYIK